MFYFPKFLKYRGQCGFILGLCLMTPIGTLILKILTLDRDISLGYTLFIALVANLLLGIIWFQVIRATHHYIKRQEEKYARIHF